MRFWGPRIVEGEVEREVVVVQATIYALVEHLLHCQFNLPLDVLLSPQRIESVDDVVSVDSCELGGLYSCEGKGVFGREEEGKGVEEPIGVAVVVDDELLGEGQILADGRG
jgi:hypothetical protein